MSINSMSNTRRKGERKRVEVFKTLTDEAVAKSWSVSQIERAIDQAVSCATGLLTEGSRKTFRKQCELMTHRRVLLYSKTVFKLAEQIWNERKTRLHSQQHVLLALAKEVAESGSDMRAAAKLTHIRVLLEQGSGYA
jgi:hypothetical protein